MFNIRVITIPVEAHLRFTAKIKWTKVVNFLRNMTQRTPDGCGIP